MFYSFLFICLSIDIAYTNHNQCSILNSKLRKYGIRINKYDEDLTSSKLCQNSINNYCCPQSYEDKLQNASKIELYQSYEFYSINLFESLRHISTQLNETIFNLIQSSRNETHFILQNNYETFYSFYRSSIDFFFNNLLTINYKNYRYDIKNNVDDLFRNILRITIIINNNNKPILPSYLLCLWRNHPFGNREYLIINQLEVNLGKLLHLSQLLKLSSELIQTMSMDISTDNHCIDSYIQLSYCNLCVGRKEFPCLSSCINVIESCLINISLISNVWIDFVDSIENNVYFNEIENILSSIGASISDAILTLFSSDGIQNTDIIHECGYISIQNGVFNNNKLLQKEYTTDSLSILDPQLHYMRQSLKSYRSFWLMLPEELCKSNEVSISKTKMCWTGTIIIIGDRQTIRTNYDKPLSLRLQRILKEMKEKCQIISNKQRMGTETNIATTTKSSSIIDELKLNFTVDFDDYPDDNEFEYSDYAYEDANDESTLKIENTTIPILTLSSTSIYDDGLIDETNSVSYYDYGEQDAYGDDDVVAEISTEKSSTKSTILTTIITETSSVQAQTPSNYHRRPIIWNIRVDDDDLYKKSQQNYNNSCCRTYSLILLLLLFILT